MKKLSVALFVFISCMLLTVCAHAADFDVDSTEFPRGKAYENYEPYQIYMAGGSNEGYTFEFAGAHPRGLYLSPTGLLTGRPEESGRYNIVYVNISHTDGTSALVSFSIVIDARQIVAVISAPNVTYDGNEYSASVELLEPDGSPITDLTPTITLGSTNENKVTEADSYYVNVSVSGCRITRQGDDYLIISPKDGATISIDDLTVPYGQSYTPSVTVNPSDAGYIVEYARLGTTQFTETKPDAAGAYTMRAHTSNFNYVEVYAEASLIIEGDTLNFTITNASQEYTGSALEPTIENDKGLVRDTDYTVEYIDADGNPLEDSLPTNAGLYSIRINLIDHSEYDGVLMNNGVFEIRKKKLTITARINGESTAVYTGEEFDPTVASMPVVDSEIYEVHYYKSGEDEETSVKNAGTYDVHITLSDNDNYEIADTSDKIITITPKPVSIMAGMLDDGYTTLEFNGEEFTAYCRSDDIANTEFEAVFKKDGETEVSPVRDAGTYKAFITFKEPENYYVDEESSQLILTITKKVMSFTVSENNVKYNGQPQKATIISTDPNVIEGTMYKVQYKLGNNAPTDEATEVGTHKIIITSLNDNYTVDTNFNGEMTISPVVTMLKGNSPAAMILTDAAHAEDTDENIAWRNAAIESLRTNHKFVAGYTPTISGVNEATLLNINYTPIGGSYDYDTDEKTLVVKKISAEDIAAKKYSGDPGVNVNGEIKTGELVAIEDHEGMYEIIYEYPDDSGIMLRRYVIVTGGKIGDTNGSGSVNAADANVLDKLNRAPETITEARVWDVNKDGNLDNSDADAIRERFVNRLISYYPWVD